MSGVLTIKRFQDLADIFIPDILEDKYPDFYNAIRRFFQYADDADNDENFYYKAINILDNINPETLQDELLKDYYAQWFKLLPLDKYAIDNSLMRKLVVLGKWMTNTKGTEQFFAFVFNNLRDFKTLDEAGNVVEMDELEYVLIPGEPFIYNVNVNEPTKNLSGLLEDVNMAGFKFTLRQAYTFNDTDPYKVMGNFTTRREVPIESARQGYVFHTVEPYRITGNYTVNKEYKFEVGRIAYDFESSPINHVSVYTLNKRYTFAS